MEKIGKLINQLRKEKGLTQEKLADMIPISREAISKWERNVSIPDINSLQRLSEIFDVTINELLAGEKINKENKKEINNITLDLYSKNKQAKKKIIILIIVLIVSIISFLGYYFLNSYKQIKVYTVSGFNENVDIYDGILISTKGKTYFRLGDLKSKVKSNIKKITLYYELNGETKLVSSHEGGRIPTIAFTDFYGYDEYVPTKNIESVINQMYVKLVYEDETEDIIKLSIDRDYINDNLFFTEMKKNKKEEQKELKEKEEYTILIQKIKERFTFDGANYIYEKKNKNITILAAYIEESNMLLITKSYEKDKAEENWLFGFYHELLEYYKTKEDELVEEFALKDDNLDCSKGSCEDYKEKYDELWKIINDIL